MLSALLSGLLTVFFCFGAALAPDAPSPTVSLPAPDADLS